MGLRSGYVGVGEAGMCLYSRSMWLWNRLNGNYLRGDSDGECPSCAYRVSMRLNTHHCGSVQ